MPVERANCCGIQKEFATGKDQYFRKYFEVKSKKFLIIYVSILNITETIFS